MPFTMLTWHLLWQEFFNLFPMKPILVIHLVFLMGWKNSPSLYCDITEMITNLAHVALISPIDPLLHS